RGSESRATWPTGKTMEPRKSHSRGISAAAGSVRGNDVGRIGNPPHSPGIIAAAGSVRAYVTRSPDRATASIAGIEVHTEVRGRSVVCTARLADFAAEDLVVVQVDVSVYGGDSGKKMTGKKM